MGFGVGSSRRAVGAGAGVRLVFQPRHDGWSKVSNGRLWARAELDERRPLASASPDLKGVRLDAEQVGALLTIKQVGWIAGQDRPLQLCLERASGVDQGS